MDIIKSKVLKYSQDKVKISNDLNLTEMFLLEELRNFVNLREFLCNEYNNILVWDKIYKSKAYQYFNYIITNKECLCFRYEECLSPHKTIIWHSTRKMKDDLIEIFGKSNILHEEENQTGFIIIKDKDGEISKMIGECIKKYLPGYPYCDNVAIDFK